MQLPTVGEKYHDNHDDNTLRKKVYGPTYVPYNEDGQKLLLPQTTDMSRKDNLKLLGGLSLHLNHLIASRKANYDWPFGTLPFGLFGSNLDTRDLETYPRTYSGHF